MPSAELRTKCNAHDVPLIDIGANFVQKVEEAIIAPGSSYLTQS